MPKLSFIKSIIDFLSEPALKKTASEVARMAVKEAGMKAGIQAINKTASVMSSAPKKVEAFVDRKKDQYLKEAIREAEFFFENQMNILEQKVDKKISDIEKRLDEQIQKELRIKLRILIYTLITIILVSILSLGYFYIKKVFNI